MTAAMPSSIDHAVLYGRFDVLPNAEQMRSGRLVFDRRREQQMTDALETRTPELLVRDPLALERGLELLAALALLAQHVGEVLGVPRALPFEEAHLAQLGLVLETHRLLAAVDLGEVGRHPHGL